jgi:hypothetical protein
MAPIVMACNMVKDRELTEVAKEFATSLAPMFQASRKAKTIAMPKIYEYCGSAAIVAIDSSVQVLVKVKRLKNICSDASCNLSDRKSRVHPGLGLKYPSSVVVRRQYDCMIARIAATPCLPSHVTAWFWEKVAITTGEIGVLGKCGQGLRNELF